MDSSATFKSANGRTQWIPDQIWAIAHCEQWVCMLFSFTSCLRIGSPPLGKRGLVVWQLSLILLLRATLLQRRVLVSDVRWWIVSSMLCCAVCIQVVSAQTTTWLIRGYFLEKPQFANNSKKKNNNKSSPPPPKVWFSRFCCLLCWRWIDAKTGYPPPSFCAGLVGRIFALLFVVGWFVVVGGFVVWGFVTFGSYSRPW